MSLEALINKYKKICRLCLKHELILTNLFYKENKKILDNLIVCTGLLIDKNDNLPQQICLKCVNKVTQTFKFINICRQNSINLKKKYEKLSGNNSELNTNILIIEDDDTTNAKEDDRTNTNEDDTTNTNNDKNNETIEVPINRSAENFDNIFSKALYDDKITLDNSPEKSAVIDLTEIPNLNVIPEVIEINDEPVEKEPETLKRKNVDGETSNNNKKMKAFDDESLDLRQIFEGFENAQHLPDDFPESLLNNINSSDKENQNQQMAPHYACRFCSQKTSSKPYLFSHYSQCLVLRRRFNNNGLKYSNVLVKINSVTSTKNDSTGLDQTGKQ